MRAALRGALVRLDAPRLAVPTGLINNFADHRSQRSGWQFSPAGTPLKRCLASTCALTPRCSSYQICRDSARRERIQSALLMPVSGWRAAAWLAGGGSACARPPSQRCQPGSLICRSQSRHRPWRWQWHWHCG
jgi:hypothetical protein